MLDEWAPRSLLTAGDERAEFVANCDRHPNAVRMQWGHTASRCVCACQLSGYRSVQVRSLEETFKFGSFFSPMLSESDFDAKPSVLLLGQYSTGAA